MAVLNKYQNYKLWQEGYYGNKLRAWRNYEAYLASGYEAPVVLRYLGEIGGYWCKYDVDKKDVLSTINAWVAEGADPSKIILNEALPDLRPILQGELLNDTYYDYFWYSTAEVKMRDALKLESHVAQGLKAKHLIQSAMTPSSFSDFEELLYLYPGHVIEVTICSNCIGDTQGRNALVWEVRKY